MEAVMSSCCAPQSITQPQIGSLPIKSGDKALWYGLVAFYGVGAIYVLSILVSAVL
jgi:hypothetical protein